MYMFETAAFHCKLADTYFDLLKANLVIIVLAEVQVEHSGSFE